MKKHPRQRGYFGDTVRKGASGPARPGKKNARRTDDEQTFVSVPGGLDVEEVLGLMGKIRHPVRLDDLIRFLDLSRRDKKPLESLLDALQAKGRVIRLRGGKWVEASQARIVTGVLSIQRSGAGFVTPDVVQESAEDTPKPVDGGKRNRVESRLQPDIFIHPGFLGDAWKWPCNRLRSTGAARCGTRKDGSSACSNAARRSWPSTSPGTRRRAASCAARLIPGSTSCLM